MIEYIRGSIAELTPIQAVVEAAGVGYALSITLNTYTALQGRSEARLYAYEVIREDAHLLFGFATKDERSLFALLVSISGVGGQTARMVLSAFTPADLVQIIQTEDVRSLKAVKGIGPKAAQRIIVELKDKVATFLATDGLSTSAGDGMGASAGISAELVNEAVQALAVLGFSPAPTQKVVREIVKADPTISVEGIIKQALKML